ncbi:MAG: helix-turn-helix transcriptional regulator [Methylobacterium sp.]|jgi:transcriptional regulator with XRE-family HTH domain|nr:helix-turn-helix transcriptional regulator [Methylobacterium sp.]
MAAEKSPKTGREADAQVGRLIRLRRLQLGLSQSELGRRIGVTYQQVQKYEQGLNRVNATSLQQLATALEVQTSYFFLKTSLSGSGSGSDTLSVVVDDALERFLSLPDARRIVVTFPKIKPARIRREVAQFIENLAQSEGE